MSFSGSSAARRRRSEATPRRRRRSPATELATPDVRVDEVSGASRRAKTGVMKVAGSSSVLRPRSAEEYDVSTVTATSAMRGLLGMLPVLAPNTAVRGQATGAFRRSQTPTPRVAPPLHTLAPPETAVPRRPSSAPPAEPDRVVDAATGESVVSDAAPAVPPTKRQFARNTRT